MIRLCFRGLLWVLAAWTSGGAIGAWLLGNHPDRVLYTALVLTLINTLWIDHLAHHRRDRVRGAS
ncbi:hypothetical protein JNUCC0626_19845 [Lentzea sp. JNUCC 0626]|uniref:hypothetical protein n=1 Tax=Lentzea sp. JNUCC 0626 TaxID=3367513 RepID=UPI00374A26BB